MTTADAYIDEEPPRPVTAIAKPFNQENGLQIPQPDTLWGQKGAIVPYEPVSVSHF